MTTEEIIRVIKAANFSPLVNGIIVQLPLPPHLDKDSILNAVADSKDVDGFKHNSGFTPCTPKGVMTILDHFELRCGWSVVLRNWQRRSWKANG